MIEGVGFKEKMIKENNVVIRDIWYLTPNYFFFVVPENLVSIEEVPDYAGLMYMLPDYTFMVVKKAPLLHKEKATYNFIRQLSHNLTCKLVFRKIT